jgi:subtilisin-like proprotein convertase family protein
MRGDFACDDQAVVIRGRRRRAPFLLAAAVAAALALPAAAQGDVVTLSKLESINSDPGSGSIHPASIYPSTQTGPAGTVNDVNAAVSVDHDNPDDLDVALVSPNGTAVHLFSDACGSDSESQVLRFDDDANAGFLSDLGPCNQALTYAPSNYDGDPTPTVETDIYSPPGPAGLTLNALSSFDGGPSAGAWRLFVMDDLMGNGGTISAWELTLDFTPPATPATPGTPTPPVKPAGKGKCKKKKKKPKGTAAAKKGCKKKKRK